ncbi:MAG TPA: glycosyltransferase family 9 protein [Verrucomicrobiae bacterium]|jgi:heptosyltransferase-2|nr:glycosyltransferase family 9 protein [Verrucomicrobiae bacterium]
MPITIHTDCRFYQGSMPCVFHKRKGRLCDNCADYDPIRTRILIVKLAAIGDVLRTTSILPPLKAKYPGVEITWITKADAAPLLSNNPLVDRVLIVEEDYLAYLKNESFSVGICLDADQQSATIHSIARCETRFGFVADAEGKVHPANDAAREWWLMGVNDGLKRQNRKTHQQIMYEICDLPLPTVPPSLHLNGDNEAFVHDLRQSSSLRRATRILGVNTGGGGRWQFKKWTQEGYIAFIKLIMAQHPEVGILLLGGPQEVELNERILEAVNGEVADGGCHNSLLQFAALVATVDVLLTSDSLAMHIGVALAKPTVVLVGPTSPWELDVFGHGGVLDSGIECLACYLSRCDKKINCMNTLLPAYVAAKINEYLPHS